MAHKRDDRFQDTREMNALLDALRPELWPNADAFALSTYLFDRFRIRFETDQMTGEEQEPSGITEAPLARAARLLGGGAATGETEIFEREAAAESAAPETTDTEPLSDSAFLRLAKSFQHSPARIVAVVATVIVVVAVAAALTLSRRVPSTKEAPAPAVAAVPPEPAATPVPEPTPLPVKTVTLDVVPKNATVYLDGESLGAASNLTPLTVDVGKKVTFKASAPGYVTKSVSLDAAEAAPETVKLHLAQGRGFLSVGADVGCEVYVDGANIGQTPISSYELDAGKRTVRFENAALGFTKTVPVTIKPGGRRTPRRAISRR
ncbi:MAG: PEGA domain-containing protein [Deltaproteobacteria bacterium]|nr:PEGA domain-containing protein [Deltaproteobacteria bacterium]